MRASKINSHMSPNSFIFRCWDLGCSVAWRGQADMVDEDELDGNVQNLLEGACEHG